MLWGKRTNNKAKGLMLDTHEDIPNSVYPEFNFLAPNKIDHRDLCLPTDNQNALPYGPPFENPFCTGYATAGYIEIKHWQKRHFPQQYPAVALYTETKRIDGYDGEGSWVRYAIQAAKNLGFIKGEATYVPPTVRDLKFAILEYGACIGAFNITNEWNKVSRTGVIADYGFNSSTIGGHAVLICGYDKEGVYIQNSWGREWGHWGFGLLKWEQFLRQFLNGVVIEGIEIL